MCCQYHKLLLQFQLFDLYHDQRIHEDEGRLLVNLHDGLHDNDSHHDGVLHDDIHHERILLPDVLH